MADQASYRSAFQDFLSHANMQSPGIQSIGLCERVPAAERQQVKKRLEKEYGPPIRLQPEDPPRAEWYPIVHVEPLEPNRWALGWDLFTEDKVRNPAMERARDTRQAVGDAARRAARARRRSSASDTGLLRLHARLQGGRADGDPRRAQRGAPGIHVLLVPAERPLQRHPRLRDQAAHRLPRLRQPRQPRPRTSSTVPRPRRPGYAPRLTARRTIEVYGVTWTIEFLTQPEFDQTFSRWLDPVDVLRRRRSARSSSSSRLSPSCTPAWTPSGSRASSARRARSSRARTPTSSGSRTSPRTTCASRCAW